MRPPFPLPSRRLALLALASLALAGCAFMGGGYRPQTLNGEVVQAKPLTLPVATTTVNVRLLDVGAGEAPSTVLAEQIIERPRAFPIRFALRYDQGALKPGHRYAVDARLFVEGQLRMLNRVEVPVFGADTPAEPKIALDAIDG